VAAAAVGITLAVTGGSSPATATTEPLSALGALKPAPAAGPVGPEGVPVPSGAALASPGTTASGQPIDGISCSAGEQTLFHIHSHLTIFVDGVAKQVPAGIGIPGPQSQDTPQGSFVGSGTCSTGCTRTPRTASCTRVPVSGPSLGQFFDEWGQPLGPSRSARPTARS
jgi:hypothetical protein